MKVTSVSLTFHCFHSDYSAVFYPGGHGPMFDLANDDVIANITAEVFNNGGVVAAVCHGPAGKLI